MNFSSKFHIFHGKLSQTVRNASGESQLEQRSYYLSVKRFSIPSEFSLSSQCAASSS